MENFLSIYEIIRESTAGIWDKRCVVRWCHPLTYIPPLDSYFLHQWYMYAYAFFLSHINVPKGGSDRVFVRWSKNCLLSLGYRNLFPSLEWKKKSFFSAIFLCLIWQAAMESFSLHHLKGWYKSSFAHSNLYRFASLSFLIIRLRFDKGIQGPKKMLQKKGKFMGSVLNVSLLPSIWDFLLQHKVASKVI